MTFSMFRCVIYVMWRNLKFLHIGQLCNSFVAINAVLLHFVLKSVLSQMTFFCVEKIEPIIVSVEKIEPTIVSVEKIEPTIVSVEKIEATIVSVEQITNMRCASPTQVSLSQSIGTRLFFLQQMINPGKTPVGKKDSYVI